LILYFHLGGINAVKRLVLLFCALVLMADMCDDEQRGRARLVALPRSVKSLSAACNHPHGERVDGQHLAAPVTVQGASSPSRGQRLSHDRSPRQVRIFPNL